VPIRTDSGGGTHEFVAWLAGCRLHYSVGMPISDDIAEAILTLPDRILEQTVPVPQRHTNLQVNGPRFN
jgi:hypothetical protein